MEQDNEQFAHARRHELVKILLDDPSADRRRAASEALDKQLLAAGFKPNRR